MIFSLHAVPSGRRAGRWEGAAMHVSPIVWFVIMLALAFAFFIALVFANARLTASPPYRKVISRIPAVDGVGGEIVTLECGHQYRLVHHPRVTLPCEECQQGK